MANSSMVKNADMYIPYCMDQGMHNIVGTTNPGCSMRAYTDTVPTPATMTLPFAMANTTYQIYIQNNTAARVVYVGTKTATTFTPTGANTGDSLDIWVFGTFKDQLV